MSSLLHAEWTVLSTEPPHIKRPCGRCGRPRAFASTGNFRLNANGNRLDAWLIYRCLSCRKRWNRPFFERRPLQCVSQEILASLQDNDEALARQVALKPLEDSGCALHEPSRTYTLKKRVLCGDSACSAALRLTIFNPGGCRVRLDRVLADGLGVSRRAVHDLADKDVFQISKGTRKALKRPIKAKTVLEFPSLECAGLPDLSGSLLGKHRTRP